ncbi:MAG: hemolysin III family protein [Elusimicrobiales bacterium]|nr:hemolysin III family protein [Elusimicrobiales bacterium]
MSSLERPVDEAVNFLTHGIGLLLSLAGAAFLMRLAVTAHSRPVSIACGVYCLTLVATYAASTLSHAFHDLDRRRFFRTVDQASIFFLIAGSFTPFAVGYLNHGRWWLLLASMWIFAFAGVAFVLFRKEMSRTDKITYGVLGALSMLSFWELYHVAPLNMLLLIIAGEAFYLAGSVFLALGKTTKHFHALWHIFVLAGSACHYAAIAAYVAIR